MKKLIVYLLSVCLLTSALALFACGEPEKVTVTFIQEGQETIVREVEYGGTLKVKDTPTPVQTSTKNGYKIVWDVTDFKNLTENIVVHAKEVAKTFAEIIDYGYDDRKEETSFTYDAEYNLPTPERAGYTFIGWTINGEPMASSGIWKWTDNQLTIKANWTPAA